MFHFIEVTGLSYLKPLYVQGPKALRKFCPLVPPPAPSPVLAALENSGGLKPLSLQYHLIYNLQKHRSGGLEISN